MRTGIVEMAAMLGVFLLRMKRCGKLSIGICVMLVAYGFAWAGHYFYEHNTPATFVHPVYSFMGDLVMAKEIVLKYSSQVLGV
jgi:hypothetical protein